MLINFFWGKKTQIKIKVPWSALVVVFTQTGPWLWSAPGSERANKKKIKTHYQLKLLSWQRKYPTFNISSLHLIQNTYCSLCVWENNPKLLLSDAICSISLSAPLKTPPDGAAALKEIFCLWLNTGWGEHCCLRTFIMQLLALWARD